MKDVFICECIRSPIARGRNDGALHEVHPVDLLSRVLDGLMKKANVDKGQVEDVICGCVTPLREQGANIARLGLLKAGFPEHVPGVQINRMCGSGQQAIHFGAQAIGCGDMDLVIACGVEMMGTVPMGSDCPSAFKGKLEGDCTLPFKLVHQGYSAELVAEKYQVTKQEADSFAIKSHEKASIATKEGRFASQILPIEVNGKTVSVDEGIRWPLDEEKMTKLPTIFKKQGGIVTAANASQISDGSAAVLLASADKARELGLRKRAKILSQVVVGSDPVVMLDGVIPATKKALDQAGLRLSDIDIFEVNEAFASVVCGWMKALKVPAEKVNPNGGSIAHGHPLGASGAILMTKLVNELERSNKRYGLQTMCIGHGMATATIIENCSWFKSKL